MAAFDYSTMWEAFVGGEWGAGSPGALTDAGMESGAYAGRVQQFYTDIVGPAFGYLGGEGVGFGEAFADRLGVGEERNVLADAEREFRLAIGDPYFGAEDPFAWETLSRYTTVEGSVLTEAQKLLEGELYDKGGLLGGETGSAYGLSMEGQEEAYTTGLKGQREALSYGVLTGGAGLASGTSGITLRSGESVSQAEDVLSEAYKTSRGLGEAYTLGKEGTEKELRTDLDAAFKTYTDIIEEEKEGFLANILSDVQLIEGLVSGSEQGGTAFYEGTSFGDPEVIADLEQKARDYNWGGQTYLGALDEQDDPDTEEIEGFAFREDGACGIGELYNPDTGLCEVFDDELKFNRYGELEGTGEGFEGLYDCEGVFGGNAVVDECGTCGGNGPDHECWNGSKVCDASECSEQYGCTDSHAENYNPNAIIDDGSCLEDEEQQCPQGQIKNDSGNCIPDPDLEDKGCGVGYGPPSYPCPDGSMACWAEDCPEIDLGCGPGEPAPDGHGCCAPEIHEGCGCGEGPKTQCQDGSMECNPNDCPDVTFEECEGEHMERDLVTGECVPIDDDLDYDDCGVLNGIGPDFECDDGTYVCFESQCPTYDEGDDCPCIRNESHYKRTGQSIYKYNCPGNSLHNQSCSGGGGAAAGGGGIF